MPGLILQFTDNQQHIRNKARRWAGHKKGVKRARGGKNQGAGHKMGPKYARDGWQWQLWQRWRGRFNTQDDTEQSNIDYQALTD